MGTQRASTRYLPDVTPLHNRLLGALPDIDYERVSQETGGENGDHGRDAPGSRHTPYRGVLSKRWCVLSASQIAAVRWWKSRPSATKACSESAYCSAIAQEWAAPFNRWEMVHCLRWLSAGSSKRRRRPERSARSWVYTRRRTCCRSCSARHVMRCRRETAVSPLAASD